ncbi:MAG: acyl-CoA synthetase, partial [Alphaproteobacteria bacterium]|nr:acyl-CoA synthetase [Alphaproteobacteria bacterium]
VAEVACLGLPDRDWGEAICAAIVLKPGAKAEPVDVTAFCALHLSRFQVPRSAVYLKALPRNLTGKVVKDELRQMVLAAAKPPSQLH